MNIRIEWLSGNWDCETCGSSWAEGARVFIDGNLILDLEPHAHCYSGVSYDRDDVFKRLLAHLGHEVVEE